MLLYHIFKVIVLLFDFIMIFVDTVMFMHFCVTQTTVVKNTRLNTLTLKLYHEKMLEFKQTER